MTEYFKVGIAAGSKVVRGSGHEAENQVTIQVSGASGSDPGGPIQWLRLKAACGGGETALFLDSAKAAKQVVPTLEGVAGFSAPAVVRTDERSLVWEIKPPGAKLPTIPRGAMLGIKISGFASETSAGGAALEVTIKSKEEETHRLAPIPKELPGKFEILKFAVAPLYLLADGDSVEISWDVDLADEVELLKDGSRIPPPGGQPNAVEISPAGTARWKKSAGGFVPGPPIAAKVTYQLRATRRGADPTKPQAIYSEPVAVHKIEAGWHELDTAASLGEPSTLWAFGEAIYGIFLKKDGRAALYKSSDGWNVWHKLEAEIPAGMETSPGAACDKKLWLAGGSSNDPESCSSRVYSYTPGATEWVAEAGFPPAMAPRMGHACVCFQGKLWVLGGLSDRKEQLADVWTLAAGKWQRAAPMNTPRSQFAAAELGKVLKVVGGVDEPFGTGIPEAWDFDGAKWTESPKPGVFDGSLPVASGMAELEGHLTLCLSCVGPDNGSAFYTDFNPARKPAWTKGPTAGRWEQFGGDRYSLTAVAFKGRLFVRALAHSSSRRRHPRDTVKIHMYKP